MRLTPDSLRRSFAPHSLVGVLLLALVAGVIAVRLFHNQGMMGLDWSFPYFSGAANFKRFFDWQISPSDYQLAQQLPLSEYAHYRHQASAETVPYAINSYGYVLVAVLARFLFQGMGDAQAVIGLQLAVHALISVLFLCVIFASTRSRLAFVVLYVANPLVIYFATYPFYYFWLCIPSACCAALLLRPRWGREILLLSTPLLLLALLIRPTTIFLCLLIYAYAFRALPRDRWGLVVPCLVLFVAGVVMISSVNPRQPPWHTMVVGLGAYPNASGVTSLSDDAGYRLFKEQTGIPITTRPVSGNWGQPALMKSYGAVLRARYVHVLLTDPLRLIANALINLGQVFSIGYIVDNVVLSVLSSLLGWAVAVYLLARGQLVWVLAILASALSFFWYFPPIPAYNFASYLLLACGLIASMPCLAPSQVEPSDQPQVS